MVSNNSSNGGGAGWGSRVGFILATAGAAVGLGNIWKFPYMTGENGGGAFVIVYLICVLLLGFPIMVSEFLIGRSSQMDPVGAYKRLASKRPAWKIVGYVAILAAVLVMAYYSVICGWTMHYTFQSSTGTFSNRSLIEKGGEFIQKREPDQRVYHAYNLDNLDSSLFSGELAVKYVEYLNDRVAFGLFNKAQKESDKKLVFNETEYSLFHEGAKDVIKHVLQQDVNALFFNRMIYKDMYQELTKENKTSIEEIAKYSAALTYEPDNDDTDKDALLRFREKFENANTETFNHKGELTLLPVVNKHKLNLPKEELIRLFLFLETIEKTNPEKYNFPQYTKDKTERVFERMMLAARLSIVIFPAILNKYIDKIHNDDDKFALTRQEMQDHFLSIGSTIAAVAYLQENYKFEGEHASVLTADDIRNVLIQVRESMGIDETYQEAAIASINQGLKQGGSRVLKDDMTGSPAIQISWIVIFMILNFIVVSLGIAGGIEKIAKTMMPILFAILIFLLVYVMIKADFVGSIEYLFVPDFSKAFDGEVILKAMGQAFFSLSIGMGTLLAYGSFLSKKTPLFSSAGIVVALDAGVALVAGIVIFAIVFSSGGAADTGTTLVFETLPILFSDMPLGQIISVAFFVLLLFAAFTSSISILEVPVNYLIRQKGMKRWMAALLASSVLTGFGILCSYPALYAGHYTFFDWFDNISSVILLPLGGVLIALFVGWQLTDEKRKEYFNLQGGEKRVYKIYLPILKFVSILLATIVMVVGVRDWILNIINSI